MPKFLFVVALMAGLVFAQSPTITSVVNGGDFSFGIAQGGFGTIFGTGLSDKEYVGQSVPYAAKLGKTEVRFCVGSGASRAAWDNCLVSGVVYAGPGQVNFRAPIPLITSEPVGSFVLRRDGIEAVAAPSLLYRRKPSVFFVGFDCDYEPSTGDPTPCGLRSTRANVTNSIRGAITDARGAVVTSLNPARAEGWYTI